MEVSTMMIEVLPFIRTANVNRCCDKAASDSRMLNCSPSSNTKYVRGKKRSRRSVHFEEASLMGRSSTGKVHTIFAVESVLNLAPKEDLWVQKDEILETLRSIRMECEFLQLNTDLFGAYVTTLQASYCSCCQNEADASVNEVLPCALYRHLQEESLRLSLLGLGRGIEPYCVPNLAVVRLSARRHAIASLVHLHSLIRNDPCGEDLLGLMASHFTQTSQRFAQRLAAADAKAVVEEAAQESNAVPMALATVPSCNE